MCHSHLQTFEFETASKDYESRSLAHAHSEMEQTLSAYTCAELCRVAAFAFAFAFAHPHPTS
jgi:hypothetical protein